MNLLQDAAKSVRLIAVSKGQPVEKIVEAIAAGQIDFGENYAQELIEKAAVLREQKIEWHFIGHLQKNKIAKVLPVISWLHSLDSFELALTIDKKSSISIKCLLEIKLGDEFSKTGLTPDAAIELIPKLKNLRNIDLRGLMTIPPVSENPEAGRKYFRQLCLLLKEINSRYLYLSPLHELSMGMSRDFKIAIEEGATMVRVGTAFFGERV